MLPELGLSEILVIGLLAAVLIRPADLPRVMRQLGIWWVQARANLQGMWAGLHEQK